MSNYSWPDFKARRFELRVMPNLRTYTGSQSPTIDVLDLLGEAWMARVALNAEDEPISVAAREAFFDRLKGPANTFNLWHLKMPIPQGTMRGLPTVKSTIAQLANTATLADATSSNLLLNSGFEIDTNGDGIADGWIAYNSGSVTGITYGRPAGFNSAYAQRITAATLGTGGSDQAGVGRSSFTAVQAGTIYSLSCDAISNYSTLQVRLHVDWYTSADVLLSGSGANFSAPLAFQRLNANALVAPATAAKAKVYVWMQAHTTGGASPQIYVDNVQFEEASAATPYAGMTTLRAGDMLAFGGQLVRVLADATANDAGDIDIEFTPRARTSIAAASAVTWNRPTARFRLKSDGVPIVWEPGFTAGPEFDLIEDI